MDSSHGPKPHVCFEVEKVIGISSDGSYRVQWAPAWVSKFHLVGCEHLIQDFLQQQSEKEMNCDPLHDQVSTEHCGSKEMNKSVSNIGINNRFDACPEALYAKHPQHSESYVDNHQQNSSSNQQQNESESQPSPSAIIVKIEDDDEEETCTDLEDYENECFSNRANAHVRTSSLLTTGVTIENNVSSPGSTSTYDVHGTSNQMSRRHVDENSRNSRKELVSSLSGDNFLSFNVPDVFSQTLSERKPHSCSYCHRSYTTKSTLRRHVLSHTGEKAHLCNVCEKAFSRRDVLKAHMLTHTNPVFNCVICGRVFKSSSLLEKHNQTHHAIMD